MPAPARREDETNSHGSAEQDIVEQTARDTAKAVKHTVKSTKDVFVSPRSKSQDEDKEQEPEPSVMDLLGSKELPQATRPSQLTEDKLDPEAARQEVEDAANAQDILRGIRNHAILEFKGEEGELNLDDMMADDAVQGNDDEEKEEEEEVGETYAQRRMWLSQLLARDKDAKKRGFWWSRKIGASRTFAALSLAGIIVNAIMTGFFVDAKAAYAKGDLESLQVYVIAESCFVSWFTFELMIRLLNHRNVLKDPVLLFDVVVIVVPAIEVWILMPLNMDSTVSFIGVFRILRLVRGIKMLTKLPAFKPLYLAIMGITHSFSFLLCTLVLLGCMIGTVALALCLMIGPSSISFKTLSPWLHPRFESFSHSYITVCEAIFGGVEWGPGLAEPLLENTNTLAAGIILIAFTVFANVIVLNLTAGLFVYQMDQITHQLEISSQKNDEQVREVIQSLAQSFEEMDSDHNGVLSWEEFAAGINNHGDILRDLGMGMHEAQATFSELDSDKSNTVSINEFITGIQDSFMQKKLEVLIFEYQQQKVLKELQSTTTRAHKESAQILAHLRAQFRRADHAVDQLHDLPEKIQRRLARNKLLAVEPTSPELSAGTWQDAALRLTSPDPSPREFKRRRDGLVMNAWRRTMEGEGCLALHRQVFEARGQTARSAQNGHKARHSTL